MRDKWSIKDRIAQYIRANEVNAQKYRMTLIHAEDDYDVPWDHTTTLFWQAVNASASVGISYDELEEKKSETKKGAWGCWNSHGVAHSIR